MFTTTLRQYKLQAWEEFHKNYPEATRSDFSDCHPDFQLKSDWFDTIAKACNQGDYPNSRVLNEMFKEAVNVAMFWSFIKHNQIEFPPGYLVPTAKKWNEENRIKPRKSA